jgi:hypothetical protein
LNSILGAGFVFDNAVGATGAEPKLILNTGPFVEEEPKLTLKGSFFSSFFYSSLLSLYFYISFSYYWHGSLVYDSTLKLSPDER